MDKEERAAHGLREYVEAVGTGEKMRNEDFIHVLEKNGCEVEAEQIKRGLSNEVGGLKKYLDRYPLGRGPILK